MITAFFQSTLLMLFRRKFFQVFLIFYPHIIRLYEETLLFLGHYNYFIAFLVSVAVSFLRLLFQFCKMI